MVWRSLQARVRKQMFQPRFLAFSIFEKFEPTFCSILRKFGFPYLENYGVDVLVEAIHNFQFFWREFWIFRFFEELVKS